MKNFQDKKKPRGFINTTLALKGDAYRNLIPRGERWIAGNGKALKNMKYSYKEDTQEGGKSNIVSSEDYQLQRQTE